MCENHKDLRVTLFGWLVSSSTLTHNTLERPEQLVDWHLTASPLFLTWPGDDLSSSRGKDKVSNERLSSGWIALSAATEETGELYLPHLDWALVQQMQQQTGTMAGITQLLGCGCFWQEQDNFCWPESDDKNATLQKWRLPCFSSRLIWFDFYFPDSISLIGKRLQSLT